MQRFSCRVFFSMTCVFMAGPVTATFGADTALSYSALRAQFVAPDHARWGEVPLWWWEGDRLSKERITWQLDTLAAKGVKAVCPIQRSPARCAPSSFTPEWWSMFQFVHRACAQRGMRLWAYDQIGYGHYGWLEKAAAKSPDPATARIDFQMVDVEPRQAVQRTLPKGKLLGARAYPLRGEQADDGGSRDITDAVAEEGLRWTAPAGRWRVVTCVAVPAVRFRLSEKTTDTFIDMLYGEIERRCGANAMGHSFAGVFQDEHPPTPRDAYTDRLGALFRARHGYELARAVPALHFDVGPKTPKYRTDFFDTYLAEDERCYWQRVYDWTARRGLLTSHDNWGRNNLPMQSQGYIDYFRTQRWFSAPGNDDYGQRAVTERNYYDTKLAASIARLYRRPRVWLEAFHSSGWGRTTDQTLSWLSADFAFGANLYDEHGMYYSTRAATWEHAAPDPHWRQPYWRYYGTLSDWVARMSFLMSQGTRVVDVAVHYPVVSFLAGQAPGKPAPDYNYYMKVSRTIYDAAIDNDLIDDDSILRATVASGKLRVAGNDYQALVFGPEVTLRRSVLEKARALAKSGGCVLFHGRLPTGSTEAGRGDPKVAALLHELLGTGPNTDPTSPPIATTVHRFPSGGFAAWVPSLTDLPAIVSRHIDRDFAPQQNAPVFVAHRKIDATHVYLVQNTTDQPLDLVARCRVDGVPELWDPFTGNVQPVDAFVRAGGATEVHQRLEGNVAHLIVFHPGDQRSGAATNRLLQPEYLSKTLPNAWQFSVIPTRDNRWGEFRWPPSDDRIGPEVRQFRYQLESYDGPRLPDWFRPDADDRSWSLAHYSMGPYWLWLGGVSKQADPRPIVRAMGSDRHARFAPGATIAVDGKSLTWQSVEFSKSIGLGKPAPWGGHSGYPDGAIDQNFVDLPPGRKLLYTRIRSGRDQRLGLRIALRNSSARLWVNGAEQPIEDAVGSLPLRRGVNEVLIDLPDGGKGMLYVQAHPPAARTLAHVTQATAPPFRRSQWIHVSDSGSGYVRKTFELQQRPTRAKIIVTAYTGYRLFVNGHQVEEDIGPWAKWTHPETVDVTKYLRAGENVVAAWIQVLAGQNVHGRASDQALAFAMHATLSDGTSVDIVSDHGWKRSVREVAGWETIDFDDSTWKPVEVFGPMGIKPWGTAPVDNLGAASEPRRQLAINMPSPYLTCFDEVPDIVYDVKPPRQRWFGWYRFLAPPGLCALNLHTTAPARVWVDGKPVAVARGVARIARVPVHVSHVAIRLEMQPGAYGGAAFPVPIALELDGGMIEPGPWSDYALPTYAGIGVYRQTVNMTAAESTRPTELDLGTVLVAAEVLVNGKSAGVRLARPFTFDLTGMVQAGDNTLEVRVANTIAPHYTVTNQSHDLGPTESGLLGPVVLRQRLALPQWSVWANQEIERLREVLNTPTGALEHAQRAWEQTACWLPIILKCATRTAATPWRALPDGSVRIEGEPPHGVPLELHFDTNAKRITGLRLDVWPGGSSARKKRRSRSSNADLEHDIAVTAALPNGRFLQGCRVRIEIVDRTEYLHMAEVQVFHQDKNIALRGTARQSSTALDAAAQRAIDGNTDGAWARNSVAHTQREPHPWWEVDLGHDQPVDRIVIWNRTDGGLRTRLRGFRVSLWNHAGDLVWQRIVAAPPDPNRELFVSPIPVQLRLVSTTHGPISTTPGSRSTTIHEFGRAIGFADGTSFALRLTPAAFGIGAGTRVRVSLTHAPPPLCDVPANIERILGVDRKARDPQDRKLLAAFYRSIAPELAPIRARLKHLRQQTKAVGGGTDKARNAIGPRPRAFERSP